MYIAFFCIPPETYRGAPWMLLIIMFFAGIGTSLPFTLPDAILGDIIDYDEMRVRTPCLCASRRVCAGADGTGPWARRLLVSAVAVALCVWSYRACARK